MRYGSVCSGIEAVSVAWEPLGFTPAWFSEIENFPSAVLSHHWPYVPNLGDMTKISERINSGEIEAPEVLAGGTPCQAFSIAGLRNGLDDERGQLTLSYVELLNAIDTNRLDRGELPAIAFWENVPGVLSSKDNAFGYFLAGLAGEDLPLESPGKKWSDAGCVFGPKRAIAWRVLDAQYFGLPQRRRRVFVIASARAGFDPTKILFEFDGVRRDSPPSRQAPENIAGTLDASISRGRGAGTSVGALTTGIGRPDDNKAKSGQIIPVVAGTLDASYGRLQGCSGQDATHGHSTLVAFGGGNTATEIEIATACNANAQRLDFESETFIVHGTQDPGVSQSTAFALGRNNGGENAVLAFSSKDSGADVSVEVTPTMRAMGHSGSHANAGGQLAICAPAYAVRTAQTSSNGWGVNEETAYTLDGAQGQAVAFQDRFRGDDGRGYDRAPPITVEQIGNLDTVKPWNVAQAFAENSRGEVRYENGDGAITGALSCGGGKPGQSYPVAQVSMSVRRLTPTECERLMGFPDGHTLIPVKQRKVITAEEFAYLRQSMPWITAEEAYRLAKDGPRYKALGNSMAVPCVAWIGKRIKGATT